MFIVGTGLFALASLGAGLAGTTGALLAAALVVAITIAVFVLRKRAPYLLVGWLWFLGALVPVLGLVQIGGQAITGGYYTTHFSAEDPDPQVQRFVADYRRLFGSAPDSFAATAYDAARIMLAAIERAPTLERAAVRDSLAATKDFPGVTGAVTFNAERNAVKPVVVVRIGDNGRQKVEAHVTPEEVAPPSTPTPTPTPKRGRRRA
jgi:hypothetical protein